MILADGSPECFVMNKSCLAFVSLLGLSACDLGGTPDYDRRVITGNSVYSDWKVTRSEAQQAAHTDLERYAKNECRRAISNGWSLEKIRNHGEMNCEQTDNGNHCRKKNVELECMQIAEFFP